MRARKNMRSVVNFSSEIIEEISAGLPPYMEKIAVGAVSEFILQAIGYDLDSKDDIPLNDFYHEINEVYIKGPKGKFLHPSIELSFNDEAANCIERVKAQDGNDNEWLRNIVKAYKEYIDDLPDCPHLDKMPATGSGAVFSLN